MLIKMQRQDIKEGVIYMNSNEVAAIIGETHKVLRYAVKQDLIDAYKFRGDYFFLPDDVEKYVKLQKSGILKAHQGIRRKVK